MHYFFFFSNENPDGSIESIVPAEISKQQYELEEGDELIPLYPIIYTAENVNIEGNGGGLAGTDEKREENVEWLVGINETEMAEKEGIYRGAYCRGGVITMENMDMGDGEPEKITLDEEISLEYGFLIRDTRMNILLLFAP